MTETSRAVRQPWHGVRRHYQAPVLTARGKIRDVTEGFKPVVTDGQTQADR